MAVPNPPLPCVTVRRGTFQAFVCLSDREQYPVEEVMAEWLADCARLIGRDELFEDSAVAMMPAMERASAESDARGKADLRRHQVKGNLEHHNEHDPAQPTPSVPDASQPSARHPSR